MPINMRITPMVNNAEYTMNCLALGFEPICREVDMKNENPNTTTPKNIIHEMPVLLLASISKMPIVRKMIRNSSNFETEVFIFLLNRVESLTVLILTILVIF